VLADILGYCGAGVPDEISDGLDVCVLRDGLERAQFAPFPSWHVWLHWVMPDDYPRLLVDRDVVVIRDGQPEQTRLRAWLDGYSGPVPTYRIELVTRAGNYTCPYTATGSDMFKALVRLRRQLEPDGLTVAVQGARHDTYPSGMARDMGGGMKVYVIHPGLPASQEDLVKTLDDAPPDQMATVDEQRRFFEAWLARPGKQ
jgi:hypothetical protein